jgi:hypothetical protein
LTVEVLRPYLAFVVIVEEEFFMLAVKGVLIF